MNRNKYMKRCSECGDLYISPVGLTCRNCGGNTYVVPVLDQGDTASSNTSIMVSTMQYMKKLSDEWQTGHPFLYNQITDGINPMTDPTPEPASPDLSLGDIVVLKTGGPPMIIDQIIDGEYWCVWFNGAPGDWALQREPLDPACLIPVSEHEVEAAHDRETGTPPIGHGEATTEEYF
jgi:uncharacterized protein YodC (DUF2158 family)